MRRTSTQQGFVPFIIIFLVALVLLQNVFHVDVIGFIQSSFFGKFLVDVKNITLSLWAAVSRALTS